MKYNNIFHTLCLAGLAAASCGAANMVKDPEVNQQPLSGEFVFFGTPKQGKISSYEENMTWNRCVRVDFEQYTQDKQGHNFVRAGVQIGPYQCKPDTVYRFRFEAKGKAATPVQVFYREYDPNGQRKLFRTKLGAIMPHTDWQVYTGEFKTSDKAARFSLNLQFWDLQKAGTCAIKPGDFFMIDKISIEEFNNTSLAATVLKAQTGTGGKTASALPMPAKTVPLVAGVVGDKSKPFNITEFRDVQTDRPSPLPARGFIYLDDDALCAELVFTGSKPSGAAPQEGHGELWRSGDDLVEFFFDSPAFNGELRQFIIAAGGGRWSGNGTYELKNLDQWQAETSIQDNGWTVKARFPYHLVGFTEKPTDGDVIKLNICRTAVMKKDGGNDAVPSPAGRINSTLSFNKGVYKNRNAFATLYVNSCQEHFDKMASRLKTPEYIKAARAVDRTNVGQALADLKALQEADRMRILSQEKFIVAQVPTYTDPEYPYFPPELNNPQKKFTLRAAINEVASLPVAVANMTDDFEEYRVVLVRKWQRMSPASEYFTRLPGMETSDDKLLPGKNLAIRRGVLYRDADTATHGRRYDILAKVNEISSVPVPPRSAGLVWINFDCHNMSPGLYRGQLVVTPLAGGRTTGKVRVRENGLLIPDDSKTIDVELEILPITLPEPSEFPLNGLRSAYAKYHMDFMNQYGFIHHLITPWFFRCEFRADGSIRKRTPSPCLAPHIQLIAKHAKVAAGMKKVMICYGAYPNFKRIHWPKDLIKFDTPEYWRAYREWVKYMDDALIENGISRDQYTVEVFDELSPQRGFTPEEAVKAFAEAKAAVPGIHLTNTNGERLYFEMFKPYADCWLFSQHIFYAPDHNKKPLEYAKDPQKIHSMYACGTSLRQDPYLYYRLLTWKAAHIKAPFVSLYQFFQSHPGASFRTTPFGGVAYDTGEELVPSIRLENLRIGMNDIRYLRLLEKLAVGNSPEARAARKFLQSATEDVAIKFAHDTAKADQVRAETIKHILNLQKRPREK